MRVRYVGPPLGEDEKKAFYASNNSTFNFVLNEVYTVYGLTVSKIHYSGLAFQLENGDSGYIIGASSALFEIVDDRVSQYWRAKKLDSGAIAFWPEEFYSYAFHDLLSDGNPEEVEKFKKVRKLLEDEFKEPEDPKWYDEYWF